MILSGSVLMLLIAGSQAYPNEAPSCTAKPVHGIRRENVPVSVENIGGTKWKVFDTFTFVKLKIVLS